MKYSEQRWCESQTMNNQKSKCVTSPPRQCNDGRPCAESLEQFFQNFVSL